MVAPPRLPRAAAVTHRAHAAAGPQGPSRACARTINTQCAIGQRGAAERAECGDNRRDSSSTGALEMNEMQGKVCVVTGGAGSVGVASARALLDAGAATVLLVDRDARLLDAARATLGGDTARIDVAVADVTDAAQTRAWIAQARARSGGIDFLFCNAGINGAIAPIADYPEDVFDAVMAVNVRGPFLALKHGLPAMNEGGSVLLNASVVAVTADPGICAYATSKHALVGLMRVAAKEAAHRNVRVNVIAPGPIANEFQADIERRLSTVVGRDATQMLDAAIPLGRHGEPREIAEMVLFLASPRSSFSTGGVFMADGGMHV
jgi:NAD(P)-dependent dehydrogenase (short-subunit alcohol dehydrogenase family)